MSSLDVTAVIITFMVFQGLELGVRRPHIMLTEGRIHGAIS